MDLHRRRQSRSDADPKKAAMARTRMGLPAVEGECPKVLYRASRRRFNKTTRDRWLTRPNRERQRLEKHNNGSCAQNPLKCRYCRRFGVM